MFESLRRMMLVGLGAADVAADKLRGMIDDFVQRGEITMEEGRKLYSELVSRADEQRRTANERIKSQVQEALKQLGVADRTQVAMLESRIDALEKKINEMALPETKSAEG